MKVNPFAREGLVLLKNSGLYKLGQTLTAVGAGGVISVAIGKFIPSKTKFAGKIDTGVMVVGSAMILIGAVMTDCSTYKHYIESAKGTYSDEYIKTVGELPNYKDLK